MANGNNGKESLLKERFDNVCCDLNMDETTANNAWETYERINGNYTLEGDGLHWLACGLYLSGRRMVVPTVDEQSTITGNCVSLTVLLRACNLSLIHFFQKMKKWLDMTNSEDEFRKKIELLERNFAVVTVIFKKYEDIFFAIFKQSTGTAEAAKTHRSRKQRKSMCTIEEIFNFCWTLYILAKGNFPAISDDLVNSYHLLLCCLDLVYSNAVTTSARHTRDMINPQFEAIVKNLNGNGSSTSNTAPCIVEYLCEKFDGLKLEAKQIREHHWKPYVEKLFKKKILRGREENLSGLLDFVNFETNCKHVSNEYEKYVLSSGDFDERIFLGENAEAEIGTPRKNANIHADPDARPRANFRSKNLEEHFSKTRSLAPQTPLTGRRYLKDKDPNITPVSTATQSVSRLQTLLAGFRAMPSERLEAIFKECSRNPQQEIVARVQELGERFSVKYTQPSVERPDSPGSTKEFADNRLNLALTLYYKILESITREEKKRLQKQLDLTTMLESDIFHRSLLACCLEIVIFSYNSQRTFPWILEVYELSPFIFYKVIEVLIRAEDGLSRDVVKHLNYIEEQILETMAWRTDSPLWGAISATAQIPSCEEVTVPQNIEPVASQPPVTMSSPIIHPRVQRITGEEAIRRGIATSPSVSAHDRFSSPIHPSTARRNLFAGGSTNSAMTSVQKKPEGSPVKANQPITAPEQTTVSKPEIITIPVKLPINTTTVNGSPSKSPLPSPVKMTSAPVSPDKDVSGQKPKKTGSLALFFRKVYHLVSVRLRDLCVKLNISKDLQTRIWTCFEHSLINSTDLMKDRHLDQILMCSIYVMGKVTNTDIKFQEIMRHYRTQPQAASHVFRNVLIQSKRKKSGSTSSTESSKVRSEPNSARTSPVTEALTSTPSSRSTSPQIRSASAVPSTPPPSATPTMDNATLENERGDLIEFYNKVFIKKLKTFALKFSSAENTLEAPPLSPLPLVRNQPHSPRRRVHSRQPVYISPRKNGIPLTCTSPRISYSFKESTSENLQTINTLLKNSINGNSRKRALLCEDDEQQKPPKQAANDEWMARKIQNIRAERETHGK